jgi:hypothetical protein
MIENVGGLACALANDLQMSADCDSWDFSPMAVSFALNCLQMPAASEVGENGP